MSVVMVWVGGSILFTEYAASCFIQSAAGNADRILMKCKKDM